MTTEVINAIDKFITISNKYHIDGIASQINVLNELKTKLLKKSVFSEREKIFLYQAFFPSRGGLSYVNYWNDNFEKRKEVNAQLFEQKNIIANYLLGKR
ncbi:hypothetical protein [Streptococcus equinus]|uniref:hypothetical protein n=1 Tax=Streptococcus equinus TaxID=1335 RepID=UPI000462C07C|nr:hypothetical protein [Streptococcus equinus]